MMADTPPRIDDDTRAKLLLLLEKEQEALARANSLSGKLRRIMARLIQGQSGSQKPSP